MTLQSPSCRSSTQQHTFVGELLQEMTNSIPNLGSNNPFSNLGGGFGIGPESANLATPTIQDVLELDVPFTTGSG